MESLKEKLNSLKKNFDFYISDGKLISLALDISRVADKKITMHINNFKSKNNFKLTSLQRNSVRNYILNLDNWKIDGLPAIDRSIINNNDVLSAVNLLEIGVKRNRAKVVGTIKSRLNKKTKETENISNYLKIIKKYEKSKNQLLVIRVEPDKKNISENVKSIINQEYNNLANYHYLTIIFEKSDWQIISDIAIYCEYFKKETNFKLFNKNKANKINELSEFLKNNRNIEYTNEIENRVKDFFSGVSYGFQFNDLIISDSDDTKILIMQKIELDETILPCPDCMKENVRGNSYPSILKKSFECQNPSCPSRSKIGRGKRFDYFNVKRNTYLKIKDVHNQIDTDLLKIFRRDIFSNSGNYFDMIVQFFSWSGEKIKYISNDKELGVRQKYNRIVEFCDYSNYKVNINSKTTIEFLFDEIIKNIDIKTDKPRSIVSGSNFSIYEGNSSNILSSIKEKISGVITSPPYYNAREYSQWPTMLCYLIDMAVNAKAVLEKMENNSYYFYNIGDIVGQDNVFITSHMSKRRLMLGFYSIMIFEILGYKLLENIIWDKGQVQSKRNSTENIFPSYIKPINCYEHVLIFGKSTQKIKLSKKVFMIDTVRKINSKGENMLGHTAPYPEQIVELILPYIDKDNGYLLDPYLGSGTTIIAGYKNGYKTVGIENNEAYFKLAKKRIETSIGIHHNNPLKNNRKNK